MPEIVVQIVAWVIAVVGAVVVVAGVFYLGGTLIGRCFLSRRFEPMALVMLVLSPRTRFWMRYTARLRRALEDTDPGAIDDVNRWALRSTRRTIYRRKNRKAQGRDSE